MNKQFPQTTLNNNSREVCTQLKNSGFLDEVEAVLHSRLFTEFTTDSTLEELGKIRDKLTAIAYILNLIREESK